MRFEQPHLSKGIECPVSLQSVKGRHLWKTESQNSKQSLPPYSVHLDFLADALARQSDNGDGTCTNPPLSTDYPDPDIIRVDNDFSLVTTTFVNTPGLTILHSQDLVNWEIASHVISRLDGNGCRWRQNGDTTFRSDGPVER